MMLFGWCLRCRRFRPVRVAGVFHGGIVFGTCADCQETGHV